MYAARKKNTLIILAIVLCLGLLTFLVLQDYPRGSFGPNIFDALGEEFEKNPPTWEECVIDRPNMESKLTFLRKRTHPFLAQYEMKMSIEEPNKPPQFLHLPNNTGERTHILVFLIQQGGKKYVRLEQHAWPNVVIDIEQSKFYEVRPIPEGQFIGAIMDLQDHSVSGPLAFVNVYKDKEFALSQFTQAAKRGYDKPLKAFKAMEDSLSIEIEPNEK